MLLQNNNLSIWWVINNIAKICAIQNNLYFISTEADFLTYKQWKEILVTLYWIIKSIQLTLIFVQSIEFFLYEVKHSVKLFKSFFKSYTSYDFDYCLNISLLGSICCIPNPSLFEPID